MDSKSSDSVLWQQYLLGDKQALGDLAERYFLRLRHYGKKFLNDDAVVEDCIQDLFLQLWLKREGISAAPSVKYYLFKALRNHILTYLRTDKRFVSYESEWEIGSPEAINGESILIQQESFVERVNQLQQLMNQLSPREREALYLHYFEDMDIAKISEVMEINRQSVSNFLNRALSKLRAKWQIQHFSLFLYFFVKFQ